MSDLSPRETAARVRAGELRLVDVREDDERRELAPGVPSQHIALGELPDRLGDLPPGTPVAFICRSGRRSAEATDLATTAGLDASNVTGGMVAWTEAHLPTSKDPA